MVTVVVNSPGFTSTALETSAVSTTSILLQNHAVKKEASTNGVELDGLVVP